MTRFSQYFMLLLVACAFAVSSSAWAQTNDREWQQWYDAADPEAREAADYQIAVGEIGSRFLTAMELYWQKAPEDAHYFALAAAAEYDRYRSVLDNCGTQEDLSHLFTQFAAAIEMRKGVAAVDEPFSGLLNSFFTDACEYYEYGDARVLSGLHILKQAQRAYHAGVHDGQVVDRHNYQLGYGYMHALARMAKKQLGAHHPSVGEMVGEIDLALEPLLPLWPSLTAGTASAEGDALFAQNLKRIENAYRVYVSD